MITIQNVRIQWLGTQIREMKTNFSLLRPCFLASWWENLNSSWKTLSIFLVPHSTPWLELLMKGQFSSPKGTSLSTQKYKIKLATRSRPCRSGCVGHSLGNYIILKYIQKKRPGREQRALKSLQKQLTRTLDWNMLIPYSVWERNVLHLME